MAYTTSNTVNRVTFESCGTRTIKGGINLYSELDQIVQEKHKNFPSQAYSFLEVKLRLSEEKRRRANMIPVIRIYLL